MDERQLVDSRMATFDLFDALEERRFIPQRAGYGAKSANVFRMSPTGVVPAAVGVRDERDSPSLRARYLTGLRRRRVSSSVDPFLTPTKASEASS